MTYISHETLEVGFNDESKVIARKILPKDKADEEHGMQKLRSEALLLQWLTNHSDIPVPQVLFPEADQHRDFIIMDKLPGVMLLNIYGTFDTLAKARSQSSSYHIPLYG
jgi:aminoglycoside phosphotransferase